MKYQWERSENESHCDFVDRMHRNWRKLELETRRVLEIPRELRSRSRFNDNEEVIHNEFQWSGRSVCCEIFVEVDLNDPKDVFKSSKIWNNINSKMVDYDIVVSEERKVRVKLIQYIVAILKTMENESNESSPKKRSTTRSWKDLIAQAYDEMDSRHRDQWGQWIANGERALRGERVYGFPENRDEYRKQHATVTENWESWGSGGKEWTKHKKLINDRNLFMAYPKKNILRRYSIKGDTNAIYMAFDRNSKIIIFLDPHGIPWSYSEEIHKRMSFTPRSSSQTPQATHVIFPNAST